MSAWSCYCCSVSLFEVKVLKKKKRQRKRLNLHESSKSRIRDVRAAQLQMFHPETSHPSPRRWRTNCRFSGGQKKRGSCARRKVKPLFRLRLLSWTRKGSKGFLFLNKQHPAEVRLPESISSQSKSALINRRHEPSSSVRSRNQSNVGSLLVLSHRAHAIRSCQWSRSEGEITFFLFNSIHFVPPLIVLTGSALPGMCSHCGFPVSG